MSPIHNSLPTHFDIQHNSTSLLDIFLVSSLELVEKSGQFQCPGITRHSFIFASLKIVQPVTRQYYEFYDYNAVSNSLIEAKLFECNFDDVYLADNEDEQLILNRNLGL